ncbi:MAG: 3-phosphoshikimate 1-carboxyvinyltransferase [Spirochaetaceae bacterium]|nr:3-phosphoshikimate 1-carboxyvinyltransferase [Spirochaetaceae bacterium]
MDVVISKSKLSGHISAISSKSDAHRALICAALGDKPCRIQLESTSDDIETTANVLSVLGAEIQRDGFNFLVKPVWNHIPDKCVLDCNESGSTLRFLFPVAAALVPEVIFTGKGRLPQRPMEEICSVMGPNGCETDRNLLPISTKGLLKNGSFSLPGNISSQYISGLLFALPLLKGKSEIRITSALESSSYINLTLYTLRHFGVEPEKTDSGFLFSGTQRYVSPETYQVEGDWSNSAFWYAARFLGADIAVDGLSPDSLQGDKAVVQIMENFSSSKDLTVSAKEIPDLIPVLAVAACHRRVKTVFSDCQRLRLKESNRILSTCDMIKALGGKAEGTEDSICVYGTGTLTGGTVDSVNDHRIVMSAAVASLICKQNVTIKNAQAVNKSYPAFFEDFKKLGGNLNVIDVR